MKELFKTIVLVFFPILSYAQLSSEILDSVYEKGIMHLKSGSLIPAKECFSMVISATPHDANARFYRGNINYQLGNKDSACRDWNFAAIECDSEAIELINRKCDSTYEITKIMPQFPGGEEKLFRFLDRIKYTSEAKKNDISGRVYLSFIVKSTGEIIDIKVLKGLGYGLDDEAIRVVNQMPKWHPGFNCDKPVNVRYNLPIHFSTFLSK